MSFHSEPADVNPPCLRENQPTDHARPAQHSRRRVRRRGVHRGDRVYRRRARVSCGSASARTAVGFYQHTGVPPEFANAEAWNGTSWTQETPPTPAGAEASLLFRGVVPGLRLHRNRCLHRLDTGYPAVSGDAHVGLTVTVAITSRSLATVAALHLYVIYTVVAGFSVVFLTIGLRNFRRRVLS